MLDYDTAIELLKKYGYSSTNTHPYIYQKGDNLGVCYSYEDEDYGQLERIKIFEDLESFETFLQQLDFINKNGRYYHIRMSLDNYESTTPKVLFLRNEKLMMEGEMFDIESFDQREMQREQMDDVSKLIYEAGDLLLIYDEIKGRQLQYLNNIVNLKNTLREKYFELQKEVDIYNKYKIERNLTLISDVNDIGIDDRMEITVKDKYNMYVVQLPSYEEAADFLKEVWELNQNLELNTKYYEAQKDELDVRNELKVVEKKLELMKKLNEDLRPLFGVDLMSRFRKINKICSAESNSMSSEIIQENINRIIRKYSVYDGLDLLYTSDYLREAIQNTNYADLALKYSKDANKEFLHSFKIPPNEVAASLSIQYRDKLDVFEQAILVIYNNHKYRKLCNAILEIEGFENLPVKKVISKINGIKGFSKIKSECYDAVKKRIDDPCNATIKQSLFSNYDFSTFESFITSLIRELVKLRNVNNKMILNGDINMYLSVKSPEDITNRKFVMVTNDLNSLLIETKENHSMVAITLLKKNTPVLYSPYYLDIGDIYSKGASLQMAIKEMINFELLVEISDIIINIDPVKTNVVRYYSTPFVVENVSVVDDIKKNFKTTFCKIAFTSAIQNLVENVTVSQTSANEMPIQNYDSNVVQQPVEASLESAGVVSNQVVTPVESQNDVILEQQNVPLAEENVQLAEESANINSAVTEKVVKPEFEQSVSDMSSSELAPIEAENTTDSGQSVDNVVVIGNNDNLTVDKVSTDTDVSNKEINDETSLESNAVSVEEDTHQEEVSSSEVEESKSDNNINNVDESTSESFAPIVEEKQNIMSSEITGEDSENEVKILDISKENDEDMSSKEVVEDNKSMPEEVSNSVEIPLGLDVKEEKEESNPVHNIEKPAVVQPQKQVIKQVIGTPPNKVVKVGSPNAKSVGNRVVINGPKGPMINGKVVSKANNQPNMVKVGVQAPIKPETHQVVNKAAVNQNVNPTQGNVPVKKDVKVVGAIGKPTKQVVRNIGQPVKPKDR